ncbi:hypothetical protein HK097_010909 [Rhizophlyctis rosea]|uniref:Uncharacterized protein n=1 Tax=Rhizophlyctis rosea TaxID=64517 RepID=A0AAD5X287_9FUNG|nr:hypothetical protein HK097_010909 [Rhizophlyctis rosea]
MAWGELVLWFVVPWAFQNLKKYFTKDKNPRPKKPRTTLDIYSTYLLWAMAILQLKRAFQPPTNLLAEVGAPPDVPLYQLRNLFRSYMTTKFPGWEEPLQPSSYNPNPQPWTSDPSLLSQTLPLEKAYQTLRNTALRPLYLRFGHVALTTCSWCAETTDYALYSLPTVILPYITTLVALGLASAAPRKSHWRTYAVISVLLLSAIDALAIYTESTITLSDLHPRGKFSSRHNLFHGIRHLYFALLCFVGSLWENRSDWTDAEILGEVVSKNRAIVQRAQALRLARAGTLMDGNLRKKFMEYYREQEAGMEAVHRDEEFKATRAQLLQRFDIDALVKNMQEMTGSIMHAAVQEGALKGIELPPPELVTSFSSSLTEGDDQPELETVSSPGEGSDGHGKGKGKEQGKDWTDGVSWVEVGKPKAEGTPRKLRSRKGK